MGIAGAYRLGPESGRLLVHTTRTGLGAKAGHDLTIEVTCWHAQATVDPATPANSSLSVEVDADSFEIRKESVESSLSATLTAPRSTRP
jgi:polyisoprenoid-binding protein YceI